MAIKVMGLSLIFCAVTSAACAQQAGIKYTPVQYFKNYALSTCIADGYQSEQTVKDAAAAARGYLELGNLPLEAHTEATLLGRKFLSMDYKSISGEKLVLMKCIDFYHSKDLDRLARKYAAGKK